MDNENFNLKKKCAFREFSGENFCTQVLEVLSSKSINLGENFYEQIKKSNCEHSPLQLQKKEKKITHLQWKNLKKYYFNKFIFVKISFKKNC